MTDRLLRVARRHPPIEIVHYNELEGIRREVRLGRYRHQFRLTLAALEALGARDALTIVAEQTEAEVRVALLRWQRRRWTYAALRARRKM